MIRILLGIQRRESIRMSDPALVHEDDEILTERREFRGIDVE